MRNDITIHPHERVDDLHRDGHLIIQDPKRFCFGVDAVILSGFAKVKKGENVLDLGTGTGIIPILLAAKTEGKHFTGLEIQTESAEMANRSVLLNELEERVSIKEGDIKEAVQLFGASSFDVVTSNPPYMNEGGGLVNPFAAKAIARHEILCSLEDVVAAAARLLRPLGRFYMIHRPHRLTDIMGRQAHGEGGCTSGDLSGTAGIYRGNCRDLLRKGTGVRRLFMAGYGRNIVSLCHAHRQSGGYYPAGAQADGTRGCDCGGGYAQYLKTTESFRD